MLALFDKFFKIDINIGSKLIIIDHSIFISRRVITFKAIKSCDKLFHLYLNSKVYLILFQEKFLKIDNCHWSNVATCKHILFITSLRQSNQLWILKYHQDKIKIKYFLFYLAITRRDALLRCKVFIFLYSINTRNVF